MAKLKVRKDKLDNKIVFNADCFDDSIIKSLCNMSEPLVKVPVHVSLNDFKDRRIIC